MIFHYISVVGMERKLVKDIPLYICGGDGKEAVSFPFPPQIYNGISLASFIPLPTIYI
jgi:hypothetical protein